MKRYVVKKEPTWVVIDRGDEDSIHSRFDTRAEAREMADEMNALAEASKCDCADSSCGLTMAGHFKPTCASCGSRGWLHMDDSCGRGPGIERCDDCQKYGNDDEAEKAHAEDCSCGMTCAREEAAE